ncbi:MAG: beta-N-acetylhexosaminidase [Cyclobacteriaceae bacterium]
MFYTPRKMIRVCSGCLIMACFVLLFSCKDSKPTSADARLRFESIIPKPVSAAMSGSTFTLTNETMIVTEGSGNELMEVARFLAEKIKPSTGFDMKVSSGEEASSNGAILLTLEGGDEELRAEGYELSIEEDGIKIKASSPTGLFWGVQTLRQLLPEDIEKSSSVQNGVWEIATGSIRDYPEYSWRGSMLDVARHFFTVEEVKHYIDLITFYKMNTLHLHLSDDQGWRIEIKSWPNLTKIGGLSEVGGTEGGFYTQEQYAEIVEYAASRFITIIPEIDMPGHINAALVSYKELNPGPSINREPGSTRNTGPKPGVVHTGIEVGFSTLDIKKEITFKFVNDVLRELAMMTPGPYLHIGGDEAAVTKKPDYIAFVNKFKEIVKANGKKMIGWEEIAQADIDSTVTVQHWDNEGYALMAAEKGAKLIFSPAKKVYLDMQYDSTTKLGLHWAAYIEVDSSYIWDPAARVPGIDPEKIQGVEAPLWSETTATMDDVEYMAFPRLPGVAEVGWTKAENRQWNEYKIRLANQSKRWKVMDINFYRSARVQWVD